MEIKYDPEADAMYIRLKKGKFYSNQKIDENTILDLDENGDLLGIEILFVKERIPDFLKELKDKHLISA